MADFELAPILDKIDLRPAPKMMEGSLYDDQHSIYCRDPSPEVDLAWERVAGKGAEIVMMDSSDVTKVGKDPRSVVHAPLHWGFGTSAVPIQVDVFHQVHCLNEIRKEMHSDHYYKGSSRTALHIAHKKHCLHMLLQNLMCQANVDVITHDWVETTSRPYADFNIFHQCRDFEALLEWQEKNSLKDVKEKMFDGLEIPPGAVRLPFPMPLRASNGTHM